MARESFDLNLGLDPALYKQLRIVHQKSIQVSDASSWK